MPALSYADVMATVAASSRSARTSSPRFGSPARTSRSHADQPGHQGPLAVRARLRARADCPAARRGRPAAPPARRASPVRRATAGRAPAAFPGEDASLTGLTLTGAPSTVVARDGPRTPPRSTAWREQLRAADHRHTLVRGARAQSIIATGDIYVRGLCDHGRPTWDPRRRDPPATSSAATRQGVARPPDGVAHYDGFSISDFMGATSGRSSPPGPRSSSSRASTARGKHVSALRTRPHATAPASPRVGSDSRSSPRDVGLHRGVDAPHGRRWRESSSSPPGDRDPEPHRRARLGDAVGGERLGGGLGRRRRYRQQLRRPGATFQRLAHRARRTAARWPPRRGVGDGAGQAHRLAERRRGVGTEAAAPGPLALLGGSRIATRRPSAPPKWWISIRSLRADRRRHSRRLR